MDETANVDQQPPPAKRPFQFSLRSMFVVTTVVALFFGLPAWLGFGGFLLWLLIMVGVAAYLRRWEIAVCLVVLLVLIPCLLSQCFVDGREAARRMQCANNLKNLGLALHNYHNAYGSFPPAYVADANGKPMHSWRVLILPYLEEKNLYNKYRFDEPWDGPNNRKLLGQMPEGFRCPSQPGGPNSTETSYVAVVGPHTAWQGDRPVKMAEIKDGLPTTILLVEVKNSGIHWMEPRDLNCPPASTVVNPASGQGISSNHPGGANVVFADVHNCFIEDGRDVAPFLTIDGGEKVSADDL